MTASAANSLLGSETAQSRSGAGGVGLPDSFHTCIVAKSLDPKWTSQFLADRTGLWDILHRWMPCSAPEGGTHHTYLWPPKVRQGSNLNWSEPEPPLQALGRGRETARAELPACPKAAA